MQNITEHAQKMRSGRVVEWARQQLEIPPTANETQTRGAFFANLEEDNFVPSESLLPALRIWEAKYAGQPLPREPVEFALDDQRQIENEIEEFVAKMFHLPIDQRRARWHQLMLAAVGHPRAIAQLKELERGLAIDTNSLDQLDDTSRALANHLMALFPLRSVERARRRDEIIELLAAQKIDWKKVAKRFQTAAPALAALDPPLTDRVANHKTDATKIATFQRRKVTKRPRVITTRSESYNYWWVIGLLLIAISVFGRFARWSDSRPAPSNKTRFNEFRNGSPSTPQPVPKEILEALRDPNRGVTPREELPPRKRLDEFLDDPQFVERFRIDPDRALETNDAASSPGERPTDPLRPPISQPSIPRPEFPVIERPTIPSYTPPKLPTRPRPSDAYRSPFDRSNFRSTPPSRYTPPTAPRPPSVPSPSPGFP